MAKNNKKGQSGGVNIKGSTISAKGDIVGRNKITTRYSRGSEAEPQLAKKFATIKKEIKQRTADPDVDKAELRNLVEKIEQEVKKGEAASTKKVERWLKFLADMADDIFQVTIATLAHPIAGVAKGIQVIAQRVSKQIN